MAKSSRPIDYATTEIIRECCNHPRLGYIGMFSQPFLLKQVSKSRSYKVDKECQFIQLSINIRSQCLYFQVYVYYSCGLSIATIEYSCLSVCVGVYLYGCLCVCVYLSLYTIPKKIKT